MYLWVLQPRAGCRIQCTSVQTLGLCSRCMVFVVCRVALQWRRCCASGSEQRLTMLVGLPDQCAVLLEVAGSQPRASQVNLVLSECMGSVQIVPVAVLCCLPELRCGVLSLWLFMYWALLYCHIFAIF